MVITHNLIANNAQRQYKAIGGLRQKTTEKLSSGYKINRAADDAAGLSISEKLRWQVRGLDQGVENISDGISACQIMDGALAETHDILHRIKELSVQAANDTNTNEDRNDIQSEIDQLLSEIDDTTGKANFNTKQLLRGIDEISGEENIYGGKTDVIFLVDNTGSMGSCINNVKNNLTGFAVGLSNCDVRYGVYEYGDTSEYAGTAYPMTTNANDVIGILGGIKPGANRPSGGDGPESALEGIECALNFPFRDGATKEIILLTDADYHYAGDGSGVSSLTSEGIKAAIEAKGARLTVVTRPEYASLYASKLANGRVLDITGNFQDSLAEIAGDIAKKAGELFHKDPADMHIQHSSNVGDYSLVYTYNITLGSLEIADLSVRTFMEAGDAIERVDRASERIGMIRARIGANQNRLEHSDMIAQYTSENTDEAESRLRDTDMAAEMVNHAKYNIISQAGEAMIAQANQIPQGVMTLLQ